MLIPLIQIFAENNPRKQFLLVEARNSHVKEGLRMAYAAKVPGGALDVFCVSNKIYEKYTRKGNLEMINASGIPALRSFCYSVTAQKQLMEAMHYLKFRLGRFFTSFQICRDSFRKENAKISVQDTEGCDAYLEPIESAVSGFYCVIHIGLLTKISVQMHLSMLRTS
jgi:hypothetical protein